MSLTIYIKKSSNQEQDCLAEIDLATQDIKKELLNHEVYNLLTDISSLRLFLSYHVYAVFDFMSLVKALQNQLTCTDLVWTPPNNLTAARLINEIVLCEETDNNPNGGYISHFQLYLEATEEIGAQTNSIKKFTNHLQGDFQEHYLTAAVTADVPISAAIFVLRTLDICYYGSLPEIAAYFVFGRENLIPDMFTEIIDRLQTKGLKIDKLKYYLARHIDLDGNEHNNISRQILKELCGTNLNSWQQAKNAAVSSLRARLDLWDGIAKAIRFSE